jgi:hypothetical protein
MADFKCGTDEVLEECEGQTIAMNDEGFQALVNDVVGAAT